MLFLGGKESTTLKEISEMLGKETMDLYNTTDTRGATGATESIIKRQAKT